MPENGTSTVSYRWVAELSLAVLGVVLLGMTGWTLVAVLTLRDDVIHHADQIAAMQTDSAKLEARVGSLENRPLVQVRPEINVQAPPSQAQTHIDDAATRKMDRLQGEIDDQRKVTRELARLEQLMVKANASEAATRAPPPAQIAHPEATREGWWQPPKPGSLPPGVNHNYGTAVNGVLPSSPLGATVGGVGGVGGLVR